MNESEENKKIILLITRMLSEIKKDSEVDETENQEQPQEEGIAFAAPADDSLIYPGEKHFKSLRMLTNGGDNAEAYWSYDNKKLIFQANVEDWGTSCDQIFYYDLEKHSDINAQPPLISTGKGRTTCSYFMAGDDKVIFASTHHKNEDCPPVNQSPSSPQVR